MRGNTSYAHRSLTYPLLILLRPTPFASFANLGEIKLTKQNPDCEEDWSLLRIACVSGQAPVDSLDASFCPRCLPRRHGVPSAGRARERPSQPQAIGKREPRGEPRPRGEEIAKILFSSAHSAGRAFSGLSATTVGHSLSTTNFSCACFIGTQRYLDNRHDCQPKRILRLLFPLSASPSG